MIVGSNDSVLNIARHISTTAKVGADYDYDMVGYNYRMTNIQAAVGVAQLERLDEFISRKCQVRNAYNEAIKDLVDVKPFPVAEWCAGNVAWFSGFVLTENGRISASVLIKRLNENGISARPFWKPVHLQLPYIDAPKEILTETESFWDRVITLPCSSGITDDELGYVIDTVKEILSLEGLMKRND